MQPLKLMPFTSKQLDFSKNELFMETQRTTGGFRKAKQ